MAKLDDVPEKQYFRVPEDYFDRLPEEIQERLNRNRAQQKFSRPLRLALTYVTPILIVALVLFNQQTATDVESMLSSVETADLVAYLQESALTTDEVIEHVDLTTEELEALETEIYDWEHDDEFIFFELNKAGDE